MSVHPPQVLNRLAFISHQPKLPSVVIHHLSVSIGQMCGRCQSPIQIVFRHNLLSVPTAVIQEQLSEARKIPGIAVEAAIGFFDPLLFVEAPQCIMVGTQRLPELLRSPGTHRLTGGSSQNQGQQLGVAAFVIVGHSRSIECLLIQHQLGQVLAVIAFGGHGEGAGIGFIPTQSGGHFQQVPDGHFGFVTGLIVRQILSDRIVNRLQVALIQSDPHKKADDGFRHGKGI